MATHFLAGSNKQVIATGQDEANSEVCSVINDVHVHNMIRPLNRYSIIVLSIDYVTIIEYVTVTPLIQHIVLFHRLGFSGSPGSGKSTLIEALGTMLTQRNHKVAVLVSY